ncbi:hypothetical protein SLS55_002155 [Diplodia seriata]|uniref:Uncharacterized protein n=1 Tax=Diplodia seriata TaxID=420778 RepID=A0ABR3CRF3_9PEZI
MPRFDELLAHYPILCSLAPEITSRDLFAVASTSKAAWVSIFKEETSVGSAPSAQTLAKLTQCEGFPGRLMIGKRVPCSGEMDLCERERTYFSETYDPEPDTVLYVRSCMGCSSKFGDVWMNTYCHFCKGVIFDQGIWEANINIAGKRCRVVRTVRDFLTLENILKLRIH